MSPPPPADSRDVLAALERLVNRHHVLDIESAKRAARLIMDDPAFEFPPPRAAPEPAAHAPARGAGASGNGDQSAP